MPAGYKETKIVDSGAAGIPRGVGWERLDKRHMLFDTVWAV